MAWAKPEFDRAALNRAGTLLVKPGVTEDELAAEDVLGIINNWRSSHSFPLNTFQVTLRHRARVIDGQAVVAQRIKRLQSIKSKLERFDTMKLGQIQDIGGCRAVLRSIE